jgi:hypothetical protein
MVGHWCVGPLKPGTVNPRLATISPYRSLTSATGDFEFPWACGPPIQYLHTYRSERDFLNVIEKAQVNDTPPLRFAVLARGSLTDARSNVFRVRDKLSGPDSFLIRRFQPTKPYTTAIIRGELGNGQLAPPKCAFSSSTSKRLSCSALSSIRDPVSLRSDCSATRSGS